MMTDDEAYTKMTGWTVEQRERLNALIAQGATIAYYNTDANGRPANLPRWLSTYDPANWEVKPGLIQMVSGPLLLCSERALHATHYPHMWKGSRVWLVGLLGEVREDDSGNKLGSLYREIIGEILPEHSFLSASVACRVGQKNIQAHGASLEKARLHGAQLPGACFRGAWLMESNFRNANLEGADFQGANLEEANFMGANLQGANFHGAYLFRAFLVGANLNGADLGDWQRCADGYARRKT